jgi:multidrug efflux pump subunit AcrA (membrane-fusion protein)
MTGHATLRYAGSRMRAGKIFLLLALAAFSGCMRESDPTVMRSTIRIEIAKRGDIQVPTGWLKDVVYIEKPALCACAPNTEGALFVLNADERSATQLEAHFGQAAGNYVEVQRGIKPGDRVIASDMSAYEVFPRVELR